MRAAQACIIGVAIVAVTACASVPMTGRQQLRMISDADMARLADTEFDRFIALVKSKNARLYPSDSPAAGQAYELVERVAHRLVEAAGLQNRYPWEVILVNFRDVNAIVTPGGKIAVFTGLLLVAQSEAGLAAALGHEIAHVVARHAAERYSQEILTWFGVQAVDLALAMSDYYRYRPIVAAVLGLGVRYGILLPFRRAHELEADRIGQLLMAKAGYDPAEAVRFWDRAEARGISRPWEILSTHPGESIRRARLQEWLPEARALYSDSTRALPTDVGELKTIAASDTATAPIAPRPSFLSGLLVARTEDQ